MLEKVEQKRLTPDTLVRFMRSEPELAPAREDEDELEAFVPLDDYAAVIEDRLRALDAAEPAPKVMPAVLRAWSL